MSDDNSSRDMQFAGFAKLIVEELINQAPSTIYPLRIDISDEVDKLIARRAYDLACHVVTYLDDDVAWRKGRGHAASQIVENDVPDMTEFP